MLTASKTAPPTRRWLPRAAREFDDAAPAALERALHLPADVCRLLAQRGYAAEADARNFLRPSLQTLRDPFELAGMDAAVERILRAVDAGETILVHGDYDVDGICSASLYTRVLRALGARVEPFVPRRLVDGYDLGHAGLAAAAAAGAGLILTGDCGIVAHDAVDAATRAGIDVVVTDHHTPDGVLPAAIAVVNPNRADCGYAEKGLCGTGVAYKVAQALARSRGLPDERLWELLDLVALATVADLVPLTGENRVLVRFGLKQLAQTRHAGLRALLQSSGLGVGALLTAGQVGHVLAPRINAVGRMDEAQWGVRLLLTDSDAEAAEIAARLEEENRTRQATDRETLRQAMALLEQEYDAERDRGVVLAAQGWHPGVIGIVASRVVEQIHRPTVLIALGEAGAPARGSARSIPGFHLYDALHACSDLLERFGGHRAAAGLDIMPERIDAFRAAFDSHARNVLSEEDLQPKLEIDLELPLAGADAELHRFLRHFGPFGMGNPSPVLLVRNARIASSRVVGDGHLKLELAQGTAHLPAIGFHMGERLAALRACAGVDAVFQLQENRWNGGVELQARLLDVRGPSAAPRGDA